MCSSVVALFSLLSAELGLIFLVVVCGVGFVSTTQLIRASTSELDRLYYRDLMCQFQSSL